MTNIPKNSSVFVDANIFIYHFCSVADNDLSHRCTEFFLSALREDLKLFTSTSVIAEVLHRALLYEATGKFNLDPKGVLNKLQKSPSLIKDLTEYQIIPSKILEFGVNVLVISMDTILASERWRRSLGFMVNDSLTATVMQQNKITIVATNDSDFDVVPDLVVWKPRL